jgi:opacity protein-like surface antigen
MKKFALIAVSLFAVATFASAQMDMPKDKSKRPSPPASAECKFTDGKTIKVDYSSPRAKGRKIFGAASEKALVPYGEIWRTGANEATTFVSDTNLTVGGKAVLAGSYTIFTVPNADKWTLIVNKKTAEWGIPYKYEADELARVDMQVSKTTAPVENFTIAFDQAGSKCTLRMEWENTRASVEVAK